MKGLKGFQKGHKLLGGGFSGHKHTEETKEKERLSHLGKKLSIETRTKISNSLKGNKYNLGKHLSEETKQKLRITSMNRKHTEETKKKISELYKGAGNPMFGKVFSLDHRNKIGNAHRGMVRPVGTGEKIGKALRGRKYPSATGENNYQWIKDRTKLKDDHRDRGGQLHREWSRSVKKRDGWKCKLSNRDCSGRLESHHILGWTSYPELRYDINNGITLCHFHHPRKKVEEINLSPYFKELVMNVK